MGGERLIDEVIQAARNEIARPSRLRTWPGRAREISRHVASIRTALQTNGPINDQSKRLLADALGMIEAKTSYFATSLEFALSTLNHDRFLKAGRARDGKPDELEREKIIELVTAQKKKPINRRAGPDTLAKLIFRDFESWRIEKLDGGDLRFEKRITEKSEEGQKRALAALAKRIGRYDLKS